MCSSQSLYWKNERKLSFFLSFFLHKLHVLTQALTLKRGISRTINGTSVTEIQLPVLSRYTSTGDTAKGVQLLKPMDMNAE
jgi:hypothetical protein